MDYWIYFILIELLGSRHISTLSVTHIDVPEIVDFRERVTISCSYQMNGHKLNSVKWYKDEQEFFRYSPMMHPVFLKFPVNGITFVSNKFDCNELTCRLDLGQLTQKSSGTYRCEVSGDAPEFKLTTKRCNMTVAALPQHDPLINGINVSYRLDEYVVANCSSDWSSPPAVLSWYINNEKAVPEMLQPIQETSTYVNDFDLKLRSLEIRFYLNNHIFVHSKGIVQMKCNAEINDIMSLRRERVVSSYVLLNDDLTNQKLINWNTGRRNFDTVILASNIIILFILKYFITR